MQFLYTTYQRLLKAVAALNDPLKKGQPDKVRHNTPKRARGVPRSQVTAYAGSRPGNFASIEPAHARDWRLQSKNRSRLIAAAT